VAMLKISAPHDWDLKWHYCTLYLACLRNLAVYPRNGEIMAGSGFIGRNSLLLCFSRGHVAPFPFHISFGERKAFILKKSLLTLLNAIANFSLPFRLQNCFFYPQKTIREGVNQEVEHRGYFLRACSLSLNRCNKTLWENLATNVSAKFAVSSWLFYPRFLNFNFDTPRCSLRWTKTPTNWRSDTPSRLISTETRISFSSVDQVTFTGLKLLHEQREWTFPYCVPAKFNM
jgi:hypothetical protein